jgi:outer membrane receptor for ferrienterochelin and colicins
MTPQKLPISLLAALLWLSSLSLSAQTLYGTITDEADQPLIGAAVVWQNTTIGVYTNENGEFRIPKMDTTHILLIDYVGYETAMMEVPPTIDSLEIMVEGVIELQEVEVRSGGKGNYFSTLDARDIETIGKTELRKAACCSLAESFETNVAVDVSYSDAVTGAREIRMLGLRGVYTQLLTEGRPAVTGLGTPYLLENTPGTWLEGISISKGTAPAPNGYQGITGQINTELAKPMDDYPIFVNLFGSTLGRGEANLHLNRPLNDRWSTGFLLHGSMQQNQIDAEGDGFLDTPQKQFATGLFRLFYRGDAWRGQFNVQAVADEREGGQLMPVGSNQENYWRFQQQNDRLEAFGKIGYVGFANPKQSIGIVWNATRHELNSRYGQHVHEGVQQQAYVNAVFTTGFGPAGAEQKLTTGASFLYDDYDERLNDIDLDRTERVPGIFVEYAFHPEVPSCEKADVWQRFGFVAGMRADFHNLFGTRLSPRLNMKYNFTNDRVVRLNAGLGHRTANIIAENPGLLASNRTFIIDGPLDMESAWNFGVNYTENFRLFTREASISFNYYYTTFQNQIIIDQDIDFREVHFYNLDGRSFANSSLLVFQYEVLPGLGIKLGYKLTDVRMEFQHGLHLPPMLAPHRGLVSVDYESPNEKWAFNTHMQIVGSQRLPHNHGVPLDLLENHPDITPAYVLVNAQATRRFARWEIYVGGENLTNFRHEFPIIAYDDPFGEYFNAAQVYAPTVGARGYVGLRWWLE